jgi:hypothetical protein
MAKTEYTPEELGLAPVKNEYTPEELGLFPKKEEYTPEELGLVAGKPSLALQRAIQGPDLSGLPMPKFDFSGVPLEEKKPVVTEAKPLVMGEATSNPFLGLTARGAALLGSGIEGVARVGESFGDYLEEKLPISGLSKEELESKRQLEPLFNWADSLRNFGKEINYQPSQKLGDIADNPATIVPFIAERIIASSPDMAAAVLAFPAYVASRTNEILNERLKNDQKDLKDATVADVAISAGAAVIEGTFERFATKGLGKATTGATGATRVGKETAIQSGTEAIEEGVGYLGGTAGTKKGVDYRELGEQMLEGAIVGGGLGASVQGGKEGYKVYKERAADSEYKDAMATILEDKGFSFAPPEVQQEITTSVLDTVKGDLQERVDSIKERLAAFRGVSKVAEDEAATDARQKFFEQTQARYQEMGMTRAEARQLATQDFEEAGYGDRLDTGAVQSGVSMPSEQRGADTGAPAPIGARVGRDSETAVLPPSGAEAQPSALTPAEVRTQANSQALEVFKAPRTENPDGTFTYSAPTPAVQKQIDAYSLGAYDAAQGFDGTKYAADMKGKEKQAYEEGFAYGEQVVNPSAAPTAAPTETVTTPIIAPVIQGKPRGRPAANLTPEEALAKKQAKAAQTKEWKATNKQLLEAQDVLNREAPIREDFQDQDSYLDASMRHRTERGQALDLLNGMATGVRRNTALGKLAQEGLTNPSITPQELAAVKEREALRKGTARSELLEATDGTENAEYGRFKTGGQALSWIAKNGNEFESTLAKRILPFVRNMKVVIVRSPADLPTNYLRSKFQGAAGMYSNGVIYLDANGGMNNTVFLHEALHGATIDRINKYIDDIDEGIEPDAKLAEAVEEMNAVMKSAGRLYVALKRLGMTDARTDALANAEAFTDIKEFVAYGMSNPAMQEFLLQAPGMMSPTASYFDNLYSRFVQTIRRLFNMGPKHSSAMQDLIIVTDKLLAVNIGAPKVTRSEAALAKKQSKQFDVDEEKLRLSKTSTTLASTIGEMGKNHVFGPIKDLLNARYEGMGDEFIKKTLYTLQTADVLRWKGDEIPALVDVDNLTQEMAAMRMRMMAASAKKAEALAAFIRKNGSVELSDAMHLARLKKVTPTEYATAADAIKADPIIQHYERLNADPTTDPADIPLNKGMITRRTNQINAVYAKWDALGKQNGGHEMYKMVRQFYQDAYTTTRTMLNEQIEALPIDDAAKAKLLKSVRLMHEKSVSSGTETVLDDDGTPFAEVSFKNLPEDYFPFKRYGQYWLRVEGGPAGREFYLFENATDRNLFRTRRARELGVEDKDETVFNQGNDISALRKDFNIEGSMLQEMFANIDQADGAGRFDPAKFASEPDPAVAAKAALDAYKEELKDQLYQTYLMTMPERSFRKQFLHAEKVTGFSADILRNFKTSATAYANQLSKLKYATDISNTIQRARDSLEGMPSDQKGRLSLFVDEMAARANEEVNPPEEGQLATRINQFAFLMLLTSPASAATQMASVPIMVMPTLGQQYGYGKASAQFVKMINIFKSVGVTNKDAESGDVTFTAPSLASSDMARRDPNLNRAFQEAAEKYNLFNLTNVELITNTASTPAGAYDNIPQTAGRIAIRGMTALFTGAERLSREIAFAMTFNLEFAKTGNFDEAVRKAVDTTHETLGRYDNMNRPRILKNFAGKTIGQFKMYAVFMTSWLVRNGASIFNTSLPAEARMAAMQRLTGTLATGAMFHGLFGTPLLSTVCAVIDGILSLDKEEEKKRRAKNPLTADSSYLRFKYEWLPENFGEFTMPGLDGRQHSLAEVLEKGPISALTDINFSSRTSFDGMWWRDTKPGKTWQESATNFMLANLGPGVSVGVNMVSAADDFNNGKIQRGLEKLVPALFKGPLVSYRLGTEGAESKGGDQLLTKDEINTLNLIAAATGFQSTRLARIQDKNFALNNEIQEAAIKRTRVLRRLNEAVLDDKADATEIANAIKDIDKFNQRYPMEKFLIKPETIRRSVETLAERRGMTIRGQYMDKKLAPYVYPATRAVTPVREE